MKIPYKLFISPLFLDVAEDLDYMVDVGFNTLHLGNIFAESDDLDVDANLGTLEDWNTLAAQLQQRNIKVQSAKIYCYHQNTK